MPDGSAHPGKSPPDLLCKKQADGRAPFQGAAKGLFCFFLARLPGAALHRHGLFLAYRPSRLQVTIMVSVPWSVVTTNSKL